MPERQIIKRKDSVTLFLQDIKLIASNPSIQPFHTYEYEDENDIMYFYYTLKLYKATSRGGWAKIASAYVTEFGIMKYIAAGIDQLLAIDTKNEGIRRYFAEKDENGNIVESTDEYEAICPYSISGMLNEDALHFTKFYRTFEDCRGWNEFEWYDLNLMIGGNECGASSVGCHLSHLEKEDLLAIKEFSQAFMELAKIKTQAQIEEWLTNEEEDEYNTPKIVRDYLKDKHGVTDWRPIFLKMSREEYVIDEFVDYITGKKTIDDLKCNEWHGEQRKMPELLKVMKDYEAYCYIIDDNKH